MSEPVSDCRVLPWDTEFFGRRIARAQLDEFDAEHLNAIRLWAQARDVACVYLLAGIREPRGWSAACQAGFDFIDLRIELSCSLPATRPAQPEAPAVRAGLISDLPTLQRIARASHRDSRFFRDTHFSAERAEALFSEWIRRDLEGGTVFVSVADQSGPTGYVSCHLSGHIGWISLLAVDAARSRQGAGRALITRALAWAHDQGCAEMRVVTQGINIAAQRAYQAAGFRTAQVHAWFHGWLQPRAVATAAAPVAEHAGAAAR